MRHFSICILLVLLAGASCNSSGEGKAAAQDEAEEVVPPQSRLNADGTTRLINVLLKYYELKNAFVKTDGTEAAAAAERLAMVTTDLQASTIGDSVAAQTLSVHLDTIKLASLDIAATHPGEIDAMRASFEIVSDNIYALLTKADLRNAGVYRQHCPMAFNNKGAYWLSEEAAIKNPYFGSKMLSCGAVTNSLK